eukprot:m.708722 g.708722  ORF g.708722 m.708722 type:complete len:242 (-) comp22940_c0_seq22:1718-2443(-)
MCIIWIDRENVHDHTRGSTPLHRVLSIACPNRPSARNTYRVSACCIDVCLERRVQYKYKASSHICDLTEINFPSANRDIPHNVGVFAGTEELDVCGRCISDRGLRSSASGVTCRRAPVCNRRIVAHKILEKTPHRANTFALPEIWTWNATETPSSESIRLPDDHVIGACVAFCVNATDSASENPLCARPVTGSTTATRTDPPPLPEQSALSRSPCDVEAVPPPFHVTGTVVNTPESAPFAV